MADNPGWNGGSMPGGSPPSATGPGVRPSSFGSAPDGAPSTFGGYSSPTGTGQPLGAVPVPSTSRPANKGSKWPLVASLVVVALLAAVAMVLTRPERDGSSDGAGDAQPSGPSQPAATLAATIPTGDTPGEMTFGEGSLWVTSPGWSAGTVSRIDPATNKVVATIQINRGMGRGMDLVPTAGGGAIWVLDPDTSISKIDPATNKITATIPTPSRWSLVYGAGALWVSGDDGVDRIDPKTMKVTATTSGSLASLVFGAGSVWGLRDHTVTRIDAATNKVAATYQVGPDPDGLAFGEGRAWIADNDEGSVRSIDPATGKTKDIQIGGPLIGLAVGDGSLWTTDVYGNVTRVDLAGKVPYQPFTGSIATEELLVADGDLWIAGNPGGISDAIKDGYALHFEPTA